VPTVPGQAEEAAQSTRALDARALSDPGALLVPSVGGVRPSQSVKGVGARAPATACPPPLRRRRRGSATRSEIRLDHLLVLAVS
jgi:hypothetical protein